MVTSMIPSVDNIFVNKSIIDMRFLSAYNPLINYTWEMLPNAKVKNSGTSGVDLQLYSGNPLDFQGSQYIPNITLAQPLDTMNDFTITLRASQNVNNRVFFDDATGALKCTLYGYYDDSFPVRFIFNGIAILNFVGSAEFIGKQTTYSIKRVGNTIYGYVDGQLNCTGDLTGISSPTINEMFLGTDGAFNSIMDGQYDMFVVSNTGLADEQIQQSYTNPNEFYNSCAKAGGELYANTMFCTDFGGNSGYVADDRNGIEYTITNYSPTMRTNFQTETSGMQELMIERDSLGFFLGLREFPYSDGTKPYYGIVPNDPRTTDITLQVKPDSLGGNILSGGVTLDTTGLTVGTDNDITLSSQTVNADTKMFDGFAGEIKIYKEDLV